MPTRTCWSALLLAAVLAAGCSDDGRLTGAAPKTPRPEIASIDPTVLEIGAQARNVFTVFGYNFRPNSVVRWNGVDLPTRFVDDMLIASAPDDLMPGINVVTVFTPHTPPRAGGVSSQAAVYTTVYASPFFSVLVPRYVARTDGDATVLATGRGFTLYTTVRVAGEPAAFDLIGFDSMRIHLAPSVLAQTGLIQVAVQNPGTTAGITVTGVYEPVLVEVHGGNRLGDRCVVDAHGVLRCWRPLPVPVAENLRFDAIYTAPGHQDPNACALAVDGQTYCWGTNYGGQLGQGTLPGTATTQPGTPVLGGHRFNQLAVGVDHACGIDLDGRAWCWGANRHGALGTEEPLQDCSQSSSAMPCSPTPVAVAGNVHFVSIAAGTSYTCAVAIDGVLYCWGPRPSVAGELDSSPTPRIESTEVSFTAVHIGFSSACALAASGEAWCWGLNLAGQLGVGDREPRSTPTRVVGSIRFTTLSVGIRHACGLTADGDAYCWGSGAWGRLGIGEMHGDRLEPVRVRGDHRWTEIRALGEGTCGLAEPGGLYCWGLNYNSFATYENPLFCTRPPHGPCFIEPVRVVGSGSVG